MIVVLLVVVAVMVLVLVGSVVVYALLLGACEVDPGIDGIGAERGGVGSA